MFTLPPPPPDPLAAIAAYQGSWRVEVEDPATGAGGPAHKTTSSLRNDCWRSQAFYACAQAVDGKPVALVVFSWDEASRSYRSHPIAVGSAEPVRPGRLEIAGDTWTFPWQEERDGATVRFRVVNVFRGSDHINYRREMSRDGVTWTVLARGAETRVSR